MAMGPGRPASAEDLKRWAEAEATFNRRVVELRMMGFSTEMAWSQASVERDSAELALVQNRRLAEIAEKGT